MLPRYPYVFYIFVIGIVLSTSYNNKIKDFFKMFFGESLLQIASSLA